MYRECYSDAKQLLAKNPAGPQFAFDEQAIFLKFDLFVKRLHKLIAMFTTIHQFSTLEQHTHIEGLDQMIKNLNNIIDDVKRKPYDLLDFSRNQFDRDFLEFNVNINDLELHLQVGGAARRGLWAAGRVGCWPSACALSIGGEGGGRGASRRMAVHVVQQACQSVPCAAGWLAGATPCAASYAYLYSYARVSAPAAACARARARAPALSQRVHSRTHTHAVAARARAAQCAVPPL